MAWMNEQTLYNYSSNVYFNGNINVSSVTHSGTNLRVQGTVAIGARGTSGYSAYYNYGIQELPGNGGWTKIVGNNQQLRVGGDDYHATFDVTIPNVSASTTSYSFPVRFKACYNSDCSSTYWDVTKYWTITFSPSGNPPEGGYITYNSSTWNTINATSGVTSWGAAQGNIHAMVVTGQTNGSADSYTTYAHARREFFYDGTSSLSHSFAMTTATTSQTYDGNPLEIKGLLHYKLGYYNSNSIGSVSGLDSTLHYLPPAPGQISYSDPGGGGAKTYPVSFTGVVANNHTTYDSANLTRTVRYKIGSGSWTYVANDTVAALNSATSFNVTIPASSTATVEAWMTYHGEQSEVSTITISNTNQGCALYGSVSGQTKKLGPVYASVNGQTKKLVKIYASVNGVTKKVYEDV